MVHLLPRVLLQKYSTLLQLLESSTKLLRESPQCQPTQLPFLQLKLLNEKGEVQCETRAKMGSFYHVAATFPFTEHLRLSTARCAKVLFEMRPFLEMQSKPSLAQIL